MTPKNKNCKQHYEQAKFNEWLLLFSPDGFVFQSYI
jgi:hypothetical protein